MKPVDSVFSFLISNKYLGPMKYVNFFDSEFFKTIDVVEWYRDTLAFFLLKAYER
jgi:hypothetical protein